MKRWFLIRHVRYFVLSWRFNQFIRRGQDIGLAWIPQESDLQFLNDVWSGKQ